jgi:hypothetical protein
MTNGSGDARDALHSILLFNGTFTTVLMYYVHEQRTERVKEVDLIRIKDFPPPHISGPDAIRFIAVTTKLMKYFPVYR